MKKYGPLPDELNIGLWVERFKQTPFQLGLSETNDFALLARACQATDIFQVARKALTDLDSLSNEEASLAIKLRKAMKKK